MKPCGFFSVCVMVRFYNHKHRNDALFMRRYFRNLDRFVVVLGYMEDKAYDHFVSHLVIVMHA